MTMENSEKARGKVLMMIKSVSYSLTDAFYINNKVNYVKRKL